MAETSQFTFSLEEVARLLVRAQGLTSGQWTVGFEISNAIGIFGSAPADAKPGVMVQVQNLTLNRSIEGGEVLSFTVDAAEVAASKTAPKRKSK